MSDDSDPRLDTMWAVQERGLPRIVFGSDHHNPRPDRMIGHDCYWP